MIYETTVTKMMMISVVFRIRKPENNKYLEFFHKGFCLEFRVNFALASGHYVQNFHLVLMLEYWNPL